MRILSGAGGGWPPAELRARNGLRRTRMSFSCQLMHLSLGFALGIRRAHRCRAPGGAATGAGKGARGSAQQRGRKPAPAVRGGVVVLILGACGVGRPRDSNTHSTLAST